MASTTVFVNAPHGKTYAYEDEVFVMMSGAGQWEKAVHKAGT